MKNYVKTAVMLGIFTLTACNNAMVDRLEWVGKEPPMQKISNPIEKSQPVRWPIMKSLQAQVAIHNKNSLWSKGSKEFFRDQRAYKLGDILMVDVQIQDKAELDNKTERKRKSKDSLGVPKIFGLENNLTSFLPGKADPTNLLSLSGNTDSSGEGIIEREEVIETKVAAVITQVLPGGNLVIYGSQEIRVNFEIRQLTVAGVIRPEDISPENSIKSEQIAEARISYGGKGLISEVQQPRIGNQIVDILSPW